MGRRLLSSSAIADLDEIWVHIAEQSDTLDRAERLLDGIREVIRLIRAHPHLGRIRDDLGPHIRSFPCGEYVIVYYLSDKNVRILRVLHGRRDLPGQFST